MQQSPEVAEPLGLQDIHVLPQLFACGQHI